MSGYHTTPTSLAQAPRTAPWGLASKLLLLQHRSRLPWSCHCPGPQCGPRWALANAGCALQSWLLLSPVSDPVPGTHTGVRGSCSVSSSAHAEQVRQLLRARPDAPASWAVSHRAGAENSLLLSLQPYVLQPRKVGEKDENTSATRACTNVALAAKSRIWFSLSVVRSVITSAGSLLPVWSEEADLSCPTMGSLAPSPPPMLL